MKKFLLCISHPCIYKIVNPALTFRIVKWTKLGIHFEIGKKYLDHVIQDHHTVTKRPKVPFGACAASVYFDIRSPAKDVEVVFTQ